ncbi:MAG: hypothetical protein RBT47_11040, partial [Anaerolineae bacterium]|nr:hypothetical protein [Anaerolineae bacterium]
MRTLISRLKNKRVDCLCMGVLILAAAIFLAEALQPGHTLLPLGLERGIAPWYKQVSLPNENLLLSDPFYVFYPRRQFLFEALQNGHFPLWMPDILNGHPLVGDVLAQIFYPPNILAALFMSAGRSLPVLAWFHLVLTGVALYGFLRLLRLPPMPALFGALAWMLNGNMVVWLENPYRLSTLCWLPVVFLAYEFGLQRRQLWPTLLGGLCYGISILGGHVQFALCIGGALGVYAVIRMLIDSREVGRFVSHPLTDAVLIGVIGAGIGAIQLLPMLELTSLSHRTSSTLEGWLQSRLPLMHLVGLWLPDFFGHPVRYEYGSYWGSANYAEVAAYYGALALPLSLFATARSPQKYGRIFGISLLLMLLIILGSPLVALLGWIPWMRYVRLRNLLALVPFFGSIAAAFGLHTLFQDAADRRKPWILLLVLLLLAGFTVWIGISNQNKVTENWATIAPQLGRLAILWLLGLLALLLWQRPRLGQLLWTLILIVDLLQWGMVFNPAPSMDHLYPENEVTTWLKQDPSLYRVLPLQTSRVIFGPDVLSVFNLHETGGYSSLMLKRTQEL